MDYKELHLRQCFLPGVYLEQKREREGEREPLNQFLNFELCDERYVFSLVLYFGFGENLKLLG